MLAGPLLATLALLSPRTPAATPATLPATSGADDPVQVIWKGRAHAAEELPAELGPTVVPTALEWGAWAAEHDYRLHLSGDGRVLVVSRRKNAEIDRQLKLIEQTSAYVDSVLPAPERGAPPAGGGDAEPEAPAPKDGEHPEDPEEGPAGWNDGSGAKTQWSYEWGSGTDPLDTETCLLFVANNMADYASILERLAERHEYLRAWVPVGKRLTGFVLERPLAAAYIENASGQEEWDPKNEIVNRVAQLLYLRRFSQLPYWLVQGFAWHVEVELRGAIYCFPYRDEFVWATEHTAWPSELRTRYRKKDPQAVEMDEFAHWRRGKYLPEPAVVSYGLVDFLVKHGEGQLGAFSEALRLHRLEHDRIDKGDGTWERNAQYEVPADDQRALLLETFGADVLEEAAKSFVKGKGYKRKKR